MTWKQWAINLLHIETLFIIAIIIIFIYCVVTAKKKKYGTRLNIDKSIIKTAPKKKRVFKHEERCREIFEKLFGCKFKSTRKVSFLKNPVTGRYLELDGYASHIVTPLGTGLAFEYDGEQHSRYNSHMHKRGPAEFEYQVKKDSFKDSMCKKNGVMLIRIPHFVHYNDLERYIKERLRNVGMGKWIDGSNMYS